MKKRLQRTQRLAGVLKQMHEIENVRLVEATTELASREQEEQALIDALSAPSFDSFPFVGSLGRRLHAAGERTKAAAEMVEEVRRDALDTKSKHSTLDKRAEKVRAEWQSLQERKALEQGIETFVNSSAPQASKATVAPSPDAVIGTERYERFDD